MIYFLLYIALNATLSLWKWDQVVSYKEELMKQGTWVWVTFIIMLLLTLFPTIVYMWFKNEE